MSSGAPPVIVQSPGTTDVTLNGARTIIPWQSFNVGADELVVFRFEDRSGIVLNKVDGSASINGQIEAIVGSTRRAGNVWFSAPGGVVFGPGAVVNVGSLFATTGTVSPGDLLDPANTSFHVTGAGSGSVSADGLIATGGGAIALIGGSVSTGGGANLISNAGTVMYGAASDFTVRFAPVAGDLDLVDFVVTGGTPSATPLAISGTSVGGNVILAVVNRTDIANAVISAPGLVAATTASGGGGDVVLAAGVNVVNRQPTTAAVNTTTATTASFGLVSSGRDLAAAFSQPSTVTASQLSSGRDLGLVARNIDVGTINAARTLGLNAAQSLTISSSASTGAAATLVAGGALNVGGGSGAIDALGRLTITAGSVSAGRLTSGRSVSVSATGPSVPALSGAVNVGSILAEDDIVVTSTDVTGTIRLGDATLTGARADEAPTGRNLLLNASGSSADVFYGGAGGAPIAGATQVSLSAGRDVTANVQGTLTLAGGTAGRNYLITANDLEINGPLTAANLRVEAASGGMTLGGASGTGFTVIDAEFQRINVTGSAAFYTHGNLTVNDLTVTPSRVPSLTLGAGSSSDITINGAIAPQTSGGVLVVGDPADTNFRPARILISGAIGASSGSSDAGFTGVKAFDTVSLNAAKDVLIGSSRFITLVAAADPATINLSRGEPVGVDPQAGETGKIYVTAGTLSISGTTRILQQNSGTSAVPNGLFLANAATPVETVLTVTPAQVVDLFGAYKDTTGAIKGGLKAGSDGAVVVTGGAKGVRFNGCDISGPCGGAGMVQSTLAQTVQVLALAPASPAEQPAPATGGGESSDSGSSDSGSSDSGSGGTKGPGAQPPLMSVAQPNLSEEVSDPVIIGAGSDELWRSRAKKKKP